MCENTFPVYITSLVNPHIFWIFDTRDECKRKLLEVELGNDINFGNIIDVDNIVAIKDNVYKRATVKGIKKKDNGSIYICWLIDYGLLIESERLYGISKELQILPAFVKQASLNNVVGIRQVLRDDLRHQESSSFSVGASKIFSEYVFSAEALYFSCRQEIDNVLCGDLILSYEAQENCNITDLLVKSDNVSINSNFFEEALKINIKLLEENFVNIVRNSLSQPVSSKIKKYRNKEELQKVIQDIDTSEIGIGRGICRKAVNQEQNYSTKINKDQYLKSWVEESKKTTESLRNCLLKNITEENFNKNSTADNFGIQSNKGNSSAHSYLFEKMKKLACQKKIDKNIEIACNKTPETFDKSQNLNDNNSGKDAVQEQFSIWDIVRTNKRESLPINAIPAGANLNDTKNANAKSNKNKFIPKEQFKRNSILAEAKEIKTPRKENPSWDENMKNNETTDNHFKGSSLQEATTKSKFRQNHFKQVNSTKTLDLPSNERKPCISNDSAPEKSKENMDSFSSTETDSWSNQHGNSDDDNDEEFDDHNITCKIGCQCARCLSWNGKETSEAPQKSNSYESQSEIIVEKPSLLFKSANQFEEIEIKSFFSPKTEKLKGRLDRNNAFNVLVHGMTIPAPVENILSSSFHLHIHKALMSLKFDEARQIQTYTWPALMRRMNTFIISGPKSGKTMAYLPAICTYINEKEERYPNLRINDCSPIALILCKGCEAAEEIHVSIRKLFQYSKPPLVTLAIPPLERSCLNQFRKQCDVVITTPRSLLSLLQSRIINLKRLCHFVIEDGNIILEKFSKEMEIIFGVIQNMLEHRICNYTVQTIVTSEEWTQKLEKLLKNLYSTPIVCIANYLEAALYSRVDLEFRFVKEDHKKSLLVEILSKTDQHKVIVICNTEDEIRTALEYLQLNSISAVGITGENSKEEIYEYEASWLNPNDLKGFALLCTNEVFYQRLDIRSASLLIHYSLPPSWTLFSQRFRSMANNYSSPLAKTKEVIYCKSYIFVDQNSEIQFPRLIRLLQRMDKKISSKYMECYHNEIRKIEEDKMIKNIDLCKNIKLFGDCNQTKCSKRHILNKSIDDNIYIPDRGIIKFKILYINDVTTFYVKIIQHIDENNVSKKWEENGNIEDELNNLIDINQDPANEFIIGNIYAVLIDGKLKRCILSKTFTEENRKRVNHVIVKLMDYGTDVKADASSLYNIPEQFKKIPPQAVDLYIANLVPPDSDEVWSSECKTKVRKILKEAEYENEHSYFLGSIRLRLNNTIWVDNIYLIEELIACETNNKINLKKTLKDTKLVDESQEPLKKLYELCNEAGIIPPKNCCLPKSQKNPEQVKPQWAFLEEGVDYNEVYFSSGNHPHEFYVRLKKFDDLFQKMQKELQTIIHKPFYPEDIEITEGKCYLAKDEESGEYGRVLVLRIKDDLVDCFFVDYGDIITVNKKDLKFLGNEYIRKLPFQVIECSLHGIQFPEEDWKEEGTGILYKYCFEDGTDFFRILFAHIISKADANRTNGHKYDILLLNYDGDHSVCLNSLMIDCGIAVSEDIKALELKINAIKKKIELHKIQETDSNDDDNHTREELDCQANEFSDDVCVRSCSPCNSSDAEVFNPNFFLQTFFNLNFKKESNKITEQNKVETNVYPKLKALPPSEFLTPSVQWYQKEANVYINIALPGVKEYEIKVIRGRFLTFQTNDTGKKYLLNLTLFASVKNNFQHSSGLGVKIILFKINNLNWPRLVSSTDAQNYIKYDFSKIDVPEEVKKTFLKLDIEDEEECDDIEIAIGSDENYSESDLESCCS